MTSQMYGWVVTRPGFKNEPETVATWYMEPCRQYAIDRATQYCTWESLRAKGYRCVRARVTIEAVN